MLMGRSSASARSPLIHEARLVPSGTPRSRRGGRLDDPAASPRATSAAVDALPATDRARRRGGRRGGWCHVGALYVAHRGQRAAARAARIARSRRRGCPADGQPSARTLLLSALVPRRVRSRRASPSSRALGRDRRGSPSTGVHTSADYLSRCDARRDPCERREPRPRSRSAARGPMRIDAVFRVRIARPGLIPARDFVVKPPHCDSLEPP